MTADAPHAAAFLPNVRQSLLLKACLLSGEEAIESWRTWRKTTSLDTIDAGSIRLLPMLATKLKELGEEDPNFGRYRGVQRRTWARNLLLFRGAERIFAALSEAGIEAMGLKGLALAALHYPDPSMRPMGDIDLIVPCDKVFACLEAMEAIGWRSVHLRPTTISHLAIHHALPFQDPNSEEVDADVHWGMLYARYSDAAEASTWRHAVPLQIGKSTALAPCPADLLLHVCVHGARWNGIPPVRWVVDAAMVLKPGHIDWRYLIDQARLWGVALPLVPAFTYLREEMGLDIPADVIDSLKEQPATAEQRFLFEAEQRASDRRSLLTMVRMHVYLYRNERRRHGGKVQPWRYFNALREWHSTAGMLRWQWRRIKGRTLP